jgi:protein-S-isoprenylcysteine O-methyltransferase Ste14
MSLLLKNVLFTAVVPGTVAVYVPLLLSHDRTPATGLALVAALVVLALGAAVYFWCLWDFAVTGLGTPAPIDAPKKLVVRGLYRFTRNPMYVGVLTVIAGWALFFQAASLAIYALAVGICFHTFIVIYEEPHLAREFGAQYDEYRSRVARWLPHGRRR